MEMEEDMLFGMAKSVINKTHKVAGNVWLCIIQTVMQVSNLLVAMFALQHALIICSISVFHAKKPHTEEVLVTH